MQHGVSQLIWQQLLTTCFNFSKVKQVILFGSRARGEEVQGSDIDLAIDAPNMTSQEFACLWNALDDLPIIYKLDSVHLQSLTNPRLVDVIHREGIIFSRPDSNGPSSAL